MLCNKCGRVFEGVVCPDCGTNYESVPALRGGTQVNSVFFPGNQIGVETATRQMIAVDSVVGTRQEKIRRALMCVGIFLGGILVSGIFFAISL